MNFLVNKWAVVVALMAEQLFLIPAVSGSNLIIGNILMKILTVEKIKMKKKEAGNGTLKNPENTNLLCKGKYHCKAELLFSWFGFNQTGNFNATKPMNTNQSNSRSAIQ